MQMGPGCSQSGCHPAVLMPGRQPNPHLAVIQIHYPADIIVHISQKSMNTYQEMQMN
jgi:hypothetical protein